MEYSTKAHSETFEYEHKISINKRPGTIHFLVSSTHNRAPSYADGLEALSNNDHFTLDVIRGNVKNNQFGGSKYALGLNVEQELSNDIGLFSRIGWNDGKYVSWAFTEIDRTLSIGFSIKGNKWNRSKDVFGIATVINGISPGHQAFLKAGGYGFIIGDGNLNYGYENIIETYYNAHLSKHLWLTADYQFVGNPGYNKDRGPVNVFGVRGHIEL
ncbi:carbohydrate porin [Halpernia sp. GG3]